MNYQEFLKFEKDHSLFEIRIDNIPIWERIRFGTYRDIAQQSGVGQAHTSINLGIKSHLIGVKLWLRNLFHRNPFLAKPSDVMFVGHPRRKQEPDGYWWDLYCDPIHEECSLDSIHFEKTNKLEHQTPAKTERLRYLELIEFGGTIQRKLGLRDITLNNAQKKRLEEIEHAISEKFNAEITLTNKVTRNLRSRRCRLWLYEYLLERVDPEVAVIIVGYGKETFIEACKSKGVSVVELQHGVIYPGHLGYSYPDERTKEMFPDYLLTWGEFWAESVEFPIPDSRVIPVGYPYLEQTVDQYKETPSKEQILFISQGTIGEQLSKFALEVDQHPDIEQEVVYKLHPGEYDRWRDEYPWLVDADFEVVDSSSPPLYQLFAESSAQIGVGSTAVYEGLCFDLETYVFDCSGSQILDPLVESGDAVVVSSVTELASKIGVSESIFNREAYFKSDAVDNVCEEIERFL